MVGPLERIRLTVQLRSRGRERAARGSSDHTNDAISLPGSRSRHGTWLPAPYTHLATSATTRAIRKISLHQSSPIKGGYRFLPFAPVLSHPHLPDSLLLLVNNLPVQSIMELFSTAAIIACLATLGFVAADCVGLDNEEHVAEGAAFCLLGRTVTCHANGAWGLVPGQTGPGWTEPCPAGTHCETSCEQCPCVPN